MLSVVESLDVLNVVAGISWDPTIRGILTVLVGVVVLMGSVYLLLGTNTGIRLGFLLSAAGFFGWMLLMGIFWWIYGIGMVGESPSWKVIEVNTGSLESAATSEARPLDSSGLPDHEELTTAEPPEFERLKDEIDADLEGGWELLPESDPQFGEASAAVDEFLPENYEGIDASSDYVALYGFDRGGKPGLKDDPNRFDRIWQWIKNTATPTHPTHHAIIQVQQVVDPGELEPGQPPPTPEPDPEMPVISVIMERDLGDVRFPAAMITLSSGLIFGLLCYLLHVRDRRLEEHLAIAAAGS